MEHVGCLQILAVIYNVPTNICVHQSLSMTQVHLSTINFCLHSNSFFFFLETLGLFFKNAIVGIELKRYQRFHSGKYIFLSAGFSGSPSWISQKQSFLSIQKCLSRILLCTDNHWGVGWKSSVCGPQTSEVWGLCDPFKESTKAEIISIIMPKHHSPTSCLFSLAYPGEFFRTHMPFGCAYLHLLEPSKIIFSSW